MSTPRPSPADLRARLSKDGFAILKSVFPTHRLDALRAAATHTACDARTGLWPHVRVLGRQFPPWDPAEALERGIWGVQHLLHPDLSDSPEFAKAYFSDEILGAAKDLLECGDDELVMELFNMLVRPEANYELRWHRDDVPWEASAEEEERRLGEPAWHAQYNLALYPDTSLVVVPGSHRRARTETERAAAPYEPNLPGQLVVKLEPGDVVFYDNNILHRGVYDAMMERMTLHGSVGHIRGEKARARNVLQHGVGEWVSRCKFEGLEESERRRAEGMRERLIAMGKATEGENLGYSLDG